jgi:hypothetical protein
MYQISLQGATSCMDHFPNASCVLNADGSGDLLICSTGSTKNLTINAAFKYCAFDWFLSHSFASPKQYKVEHVNSYAELSQARVFFLEDLCICRIPYNAHETAEGTMIGKPEVAGN